MQTQIPFTFPVIRNFQKRLKAKGDQIVTRTLHSFIQNVAFPKAERFRCVGNKRIEMDAVMNARHFVHGCVHLLYGRRRIFSSTFSTFSPRSHNANVIPRLSSSLLAARRIFDIRETEEWNWNLPRRELYLKGRIWSRKI